MSTRFRLVASRSMQRDARESRLEPLRFWRATRRIIAGSVRYKLAARPREIRYYETQTRASVKNDCRVCLSSTASRSPREIKCGRFFLLPERNVSYIRTADIESYCQLSRFNWPRSLNVGLKRKGFYIFVGGLCNFVGN